MPGELVEWAEVKLRVLHLEDNRDDVELVRRSLTRDGIGCDVHAVSTGPEYLAALQRSEFDLILSDSGVPGFDGQSAMAAAYDRFPGVPFIVVSGNPPPAGELGLQPAGSIAKTDLGALAPEVRRVLRNSSIPTEEPLTTAGADGMRQLVSVVQRLSLARNLQAVMDIVRRAARNLVNADGATFVLRDGDMCYYAEEDAIGPLWKGKRFPLTACISGWSMLNRQAAVIPDIYQDERIPHNAYRPTFVQALVMTPIRTIAPVGAIGVYWADNHQATAAEVDLLQALADSTSVAIESVDLLANLEERVHDRTQELFRRSAELEVLNRELEAFSYSVAHDLRSPLVTIDGFSRLLLENCGTQLDAEGHGHLERITGAAQRMHRLIDDLLELSKVVRAPMHHAAVDLSSLALEIAQGLRDAAPDRQAQIEVEPDLIVEGDAGLLRIVLENLLSNAWKFTSKIDAARIEFGTRPDRSGRTAYYVRDNGAGFDPRQAANLFSPFRRLHPESQFPGTGVGLATVQRIIHRHGGEITAEAAVDRGACFSFTLPTAGF